ncbi:hypothetical protein FGG08_007221 [Glutinoglossum americanum]|uniref:LamG-like jellyroll fold domain-containing protein n=1 Tax=Glutinoglossum americanum TaxID=1670608 RepID=A0A9P8HUP4_9PEZI|nr:hypothetical protein FGG08_007221 [Glutinoglossum americanum]
MIATGPFLLGQESVGAPTPASHWTEESDVIWTTPSHDASGSLPLGNGEVGINLWVEEGGDLLFYISRSDSFAETARLLKVGQVRVSFSPNPFVAGKPFRQALRLRDGLCEITAGDGQQAVTLQVFVDADHPVVHCVGTTTGPMSVKVHVESWRTEAHTITDGDEMISAWHLKGAPFPITESADIFPGVSKTAVAWYHRNESSPAFSASLKTQGLESAANTVHDPLLHRTFGGWATGDSNFTATDSRTLSTTELVEAFAFRVAAPCQQSTNVAAWLTAAGKSADAAKDAAKARQRTTAWWRAYWERSWVVVSGDRGISIPGERHPLRIGYDSDKQNLFPGTLGRTSVYSRALSDAEVVKLTTAAFDQAVPVTMGLIGTGDGTQRELPNASLDFSHGVTMEAWIKPDGERVGRIFDKTTAGLRDGFLFDIYPKDTLRVLFGARDLNVPAVLKAGVWQHVALTLDADSGAVWLYLDGKRVGGWPGTEARSPVTQGYTLQRYMQACGGRGTYPIKFNGGIFTVEPKVDGRPHNADWRAWGETHWFQNVRHMYHPMIAGGDFEMMLPFFRMYENVRPLAEARTRLYHNAEGTYFPETMTVWGTYPNSDYGWDRTGKQPKEVDTPWWRWAWNQGPELVALMLDHWDYTQDATFLKAHTLPMAVSILKYFDTRFAKEPGAAEIAGRIRLDPAQAVETYQSGVVNDMPTVAGINEIASRLCTLPESATTPDQGEFFQHMKATAPRLPTQEVFVDGVRSYTLAPAQKYDSKRSNVENPELYAVWPFRLYGIGRPDLKAARLAYERRGSPLEVGWSYDGNCAALLGLTDEAARLLKIKCANSNGRHRWPATWGPNFDWLPDQNHGGNLLETTQLMLLQSVGDRILLLPAWPKNWDVSFKLHAPRRTTVECVYRAGRMERLVVTPESRAKDVVLPTML